MWLTAELYRRYRLRQPPGEQPPQYPDASA
jgi:hypothetical protein